MAAISPQVLELLDQVCRVASSYDEAEEYSPWHNRAFFRKVKGCNFLFANEKPDYLDVILRLPKAQHDAALTLPFVTPGFSLENKSWLNAKIRTQSELNTVLPWIDLSYRISDPFRGPADVIEGEVPLVLDFLDQLRQAVKQYGEIEEFFPYGSRAFRQPPKGSIFLYATEQPDNLMVNVRLPFGEREHALELDFVEVPKYIGHKGWVSATVRDEEELDLVLAWLDLSYEMNKPARKSRPRKQAT